MPTVQVLSSYTGLDSAGSGNGGEPPDTQGAAGPSSVVETVNQAISIYTPKNTGATPVTDTLSDFYFTQGGLPPLAVAAGNTENQTDPFTIYDSQVQRFIVGDVDFEGDANGNPVNNGKNALLLAVSTSSNPTDLTKSNWFFYEVNTAEAGVAIQDYPGNPGYNADALVVTLNSFSTTADLHTQVNAISINALINGTALTKGTNLFQTDYSGEFLPRPATMPDSTPGGPMWMVAAPNVGGQNIAPGTAVNTIDVVKMTNVLSATPTFTTTTLTVTPYYQAVAPLQPNGQPLTGPGFIDARILKTAELNGTVVASQITSNASGNEDNASWYAINVSGASPALEQQGAVSGGPNVYNTYPAVDLNSRGDIGMTFQQSTNTEFESMFVTGHTSADAAGTMETPVLVQAGTSNYTGLPGGPRQGDMTGINVDSDGSFWAFTEWANNETSPNWGTAIANFSLAPAISVLLNSAVEGQPFTNVPVATFVDASGVPLSSYTVSIGWGDGTASDGTVVPIGTNTFEILGSHTYINAGKYTLVVSVNNTLTTLGPASGIVNVADAPLTGSAQVINATAGEFVSNALVAVFDDTDPTLRPASQYAATIIWSEGNGLSATSAGTIVALGNNLFSVYGSSPFSYPYGGLFPVQVVVRDSLGGGTVTITSKANVAHNTAIPPLVPQYQSDTNPSNSLFVRMEDALTNVLHAEQLLLTALGFGTLQEQEAGFSNLVNAFYAYETAVFQYDMSLPGA